MVRKVISRQNHNTQHHGSTHRPFSNYTPLSYFPRLGQFYNILRLLKKTTGRFYASQTTKLVARESRVNFTWYQQVIMLLQCPNYKHSYVIFCQILEKKFSFSNLVKKVERLTCLPFLTKPYTNVFIYCHGFSCFSLVNVNKFAGCRYLWISLFKTKLNA